MRNTEIKEVNITVIKTDKGYEVHDGQHVKNFKHPMYAQMYAAYLQKTLKKI